MRIRICKDFYKTRWFKALICGVVGVGALPPYFCYLCLFVSFSGLIFLLDRVESRGEAMKVGYAFGFGFFSVGLAWVSRALMIEGMGFEALAPLPPIGFGIWGGLFPMLASVVAWYAPRGVRRALAFAGAWTLSEMFRAWFLTGFPWNLIATVWTDCPVVLQTASLFGAYGLGMVTVFAASLLGLMKRPLRQKANLIAVVPFVILSVLAGFGGYRLKAVENVKPINGVLLRLVQANIPQGQKWSRDQAERNLMKHVHLSRAKGAEKVTHVLWAETATQFRLTQDEFARGMITSALLPDAILLAGSLRTEPAKNTYPPYKMYNSVVAVNDIGKELGYYDKSHLVPFGEYAPLASVFPFMRKLVPGAIDFSRGKGVRTTNIPRTLPVGILVCYEVIFPAHVVDEAERPYWLMNATNDGWYGISAGPYQHFAAAQMRAVEEGIPLARVANTGISGMIDAYGRVTASLPLGTAGYADVELPRRTDKPTLYARFGNSLPIGLAVLVLGLAFLAKGKKQ